MSNFSFFFLSALFLSFFFAFWNGFTDAAYSISTTVATRALSPVKAVLLSAIGHFAGLLFGTAVAETIGKGIVNEGIVDTKFIFAFLAGGLLWDVATWFFALPISETHVLIGAMMGAGLVAGGVKAVKLVSIINKVVVPMITSPLLAFGLGLVLIGLMVRIFRQLPATKANKIFRHLQIISSFLFSVSHGTNDAQKSMGIVTLLLYKYEYLPEFIVPLWVMVLCYLFLSFGTLLGGWKIVKTMATGITKLRPYQGFGAELSSALVLFATARIGFPVSTTHAVSGAIMGVGVSKRISAVRWVTARKIVIAWIVTMPISALFAGVIYFLIRRIFP